MTTSNNGDGPGAQTEQEVAWADIEAALDVIVAPLLAAGWAKTDQFHDHELDGSVAYDLERRGSRIELELYSWGQLVAYPNPEPTAAQVEDPEPTEPLFVLSEPSPELINEQFRIQGWLSDPL